MGGCPSGQLTTYAVVMKQPERVVEPVLTPPLPPEPLASLGHIRCRRIFRSTHWLSGHVLRYQSITKMAEGGVDIITAMRLAGHVTDKTWSKHSQVRMDSVCERS